MILRGLYLAPHFEHGFGRGCDQLPSITSAFPHRVSATFLAFSLMPSPGWPSTTGP